MVNKSDQLTFWLEESPASLPALPASEKAQPMIGGYGQTSFDWPAKYYPSGSWQRTLLESLQSSLTDLSGSTKAWNRRVTKSSRSLWVLMTAEHPTSENEHGSLADWPIPTASEYGTSNNGCPGDGRMQYATKGRPSLQTMAKESATPATLNWPTPLASDNRGSAGKDKNELPNAVRAIWPTPTAGDGKASGSRNLPGSKAHPVASLTDATVRAPWATPLARDSRTFSGAASMPGRQGADPLALQVSQIDGQPDAANLSTIGSLPASSKSPLRLSASWVACLMGLPDDWGCVSIDRASKLWGTASSRKFPTKSALPSPDAKD